MVEKNGVDCNISVNHPCSLIAHSQHLAPESGLPVHIFRRVCRQPPIDAESCRGQHQQHGSQLGLHQN